MKGRSNSLKRWIIDSSPMAPIARTVRGHLQDLTAYAGIWRDRFRCVVRGIYVPAGDQIGLLLRNRLADRAMRRNWPKQENVLHVFLAYGLSNWEAMLPNAFSVFGKVTVFEWRGEGYDDRRPDWLSRRDAMNRAMLDALRAANARHPVDVVVGFFSGYTVSPETILEMRLAGTAVFNWCFDDKVNFPGKRYGGRYSSPAALSAAVDLSLTSAPDSVIRYMLHGGLAWFAPEAADPEPSRRGDGVFDYEVSFVGARYGARERFIRRLNSAGIAVSCFGPGWGGGEIPHDRMMEIFSRSRINLGFSNIGYSTRLACLKGRDFEVPMAGGLYLTKHHGDLEKVYDIGSEIVTYTSFHDAVKKIKILLADPDMAERIRRAGYRRARSEHTYRARFGRVFRACGITE